MLNSILTRLRNILRGVKCLYACYPATWIPVYGKNIGLYSSGLQIYVYQYGHGDCDLEYIWSYDLRNPLHLGGIMGFIFAAHAMSLDAGVYQERMAEEYAWSSHEALYDFLKKIKLEFDPNYITGAGIAFDKALK